MATQENPIDKLYSVLNRDGLYTKDINSFKQKYSTPQEIEKLYNVVYRDEYYTKDINSFKEKYFPKQSAVSSRGSKNTAVTSTEPSQPSQEPNILPTFENEIKIDKPSFILEQPKKVELSINAGTIEDREQPISFEDWVARKQTSTTTGEDVTDLRTNPNYWDLEGMYTHQTEVGNYSPTDRQLLTFTKPSNPLFSTRSEYYNGDDKGQSGTVATWNRGEDGKFQLKLGSFNKQSNDMGTIIDTFVKMYPSQTLVDVDNNIIYKDGEVYDDYFQDYYNKKENNISLGESAGNSWDNFKTQLARFVPEVQIASADIWENLLGKEAADSFYKWDKDGMTVDQVRDEAYAELAILDDAVKQTKGNFVDNIRTGNFSGLLANTIEAVGNGGASIIPAIATLGGGTVMQMAGNTISEYNKAKANNLGITVGELYDSGRADLGVPLSISALASVSELAGLKGIGNAITKKLSSSFVRNATTLGMEYNKEGLTELFQNGLQAVNKAVAEGKDNLTEEFTNAIFSKQGLETYLMGVVAAGGIGTLGRIGRGVVNKSYKAAVNNSVKEISDIEQDLQNPNLSTAVKENLENIVQQKVKEIVDSVEKDTQEFESLTTEQKKEVVQINNKINVLEETINTEGVSDTTKQIAQEELSSIENTRENLEAIINDDSIPADSNVKFDAQQALNKLDAETPDDVANNLKDVEATSKALEVVDKKKLTPMKMVGQLTKDLPNKGDRKRLKTPTGDVGDNYNVGNVEVTLSEDFDFGELNGEEQQADVSINFIGVTKKDSLGKGLASKELDRIIALADTRGMSLSLVVDPQGATFGVEGLDKVGLLNTEQLKEWYSRKGFLFDEDSSYGFRPAKNKKQLAEAYHKAKADSSNPELVEAVEDLLDNSKQTTEQTTEDIAIEETVPTPPPDKIQEIRDRRAEIFTRIRQKTTVNSGVNPEVLSDLIELGATYIEEGVVRFKDFAERLRSDYNNKITDGELRDIYRQSANKLGYNVRGFSESARTNETFSEETRNSVDEIENLYEVQNYSSIQERLDEMSETDKLLLVSDLSNTLNRLTKSSDNIAVLAAIDLLNKFNAEGRTDEAKALIEKVSPIGTVAGQILRQFGELKSSTADSFVEFIKTYLKGVTLNKKQEEELKNLFTRAQEVRKSREELTNALYNDPYDKELSKKVKQSLIELEDAQRGLDDYLSSLKGEDIYNKLSSIMKGNLLTGKTQVINITSNISEALKNGVINVASIIPDRALKLYTGNTTRFVKVQQGIGEAISDGVKKAYRQASKGSTGTELTKYDTSSRLKPFEELGRVFIAKNRPEDYTLGEGALDLLTGLTSLNARLQYNMLPFADSPFSNAAGRMEANRIAKSLNLTEKEYRQFIIRPDDISQERITSAEQRQTFQGNNAVTRLYNEMLGYVETIPNKHIKGVVKVIISALSPFVKTPSNITWAAVNFSVPIIPLIRASANIPKLVKMVEGGKGKTLQAKNLQSDISKDLGAVVVGAVAVQTSIYLIKNLLVTGDAPDEKERKKEKDFMFIAQPPNTINITGLNRVMQGGKGEYKVGDVTTSYKGAGLFGNVLGITYKSVGKDILQKKRDSRYVTITGNPYYTEDDSTNANEFMGALISNLPASLSYSMDESYFQGIASTLEALKEGKFKGLAGQLGKTISSIGIPNQVTQIMRATDEEYKSVWTEDDWDYAVNIIKDRWSGIDDTQIDYDMWGRKKLRNPKGTNPWIYNTIDIFRTQTAQKEDDITIKVLDILRKTNNTAVIPSPEDGVLKLKSSDKKQTKLRGEPRFKLNEFVGKERMKLAKKRLATYKTETENTEKLERISKQLSDDYSIASKIGVRKFKTWLKKQPLKKRKEWGVSI